MASVADQHCASCIGTLPFPIPRPVRDVLWGGYTEQSSQRLVAPTDRTVYTDMPMVSGHATATFTVVFLHPPPALPRIIHRLNNTLQLAQRD